MLGDKEIIAFVGVCNADKARAMAAAGRGQKDETELRRLLAEANRIG